ncbi:MAG: hypothetical protein HQM02_11445, partial [Magnetococcales bacterium]|nr:hypothetical protein [Magnetococcales bacterium]
MERELEVSAEEPEEVPRPVVRSWTRRHGFGHALLFSWLVHALVMGGLIWLRTGEERPPVPPHIPVRLVFLPESKPSVPTPKQVDALAEEDHQATARPGKQTREARSPDAMPDPPAAPPVAPSGQPVAQAESQPVAPSPPPPPPAAPPPKTFPPPGRPGKTPDPHPKPGPPPPAT